MTFRQSRITDNLRLRARVLQAIREFFTINDFLEVETPVRIPAPAPEANIDAVKSEDWYLQTSPELCMKRLLAAGYDRVFQICRCFRGRERGEKHLPEFTLLEWYGAGFDYQDLMKQTEMLIQLTAGCAGKEGTWDYRGHPINTDASWTQMTVAESFDRYASLSMQKALETGRFDECMGLEIEPRLGFENPVFLYDYPVEMGALARQKAGNPLVAERFELYICGLELCNGFSELTDPAEQRERFQTELEHRQKTGREMYPMPEKFLKSLSSMPSCAGNALGVDRLIMLLTDTDQVDDVVAFTPEEL